MLVFFVCLSKQAPTNRIAWEHWPDTDRAQCMTHVWSCTSWRSIERRWNWF